MTPEILFVKTLEDIEKKLQANDSYELLGISALLRKLLFDKNCLYDLANQQHKIKLKFVVGNDYAPKSKQLREGSFWSQQDSFDPETAPPHVIPIEISRKNFSKKVILITGKNEHTVIETIKYVAHVVGGVHVGSPENSKESELQKLDQLNNLGGHSMVVRQLMSISRVVLKAMNPLREKILLNK
jgi:hypothetical protein